MNLPIADWVGVTGAATIVVAYFLLQSGRWKASSLKFSLANCVGAAGILVSLLQSFNLSAFVIESFWLAISLYGVARALQHKSLTDMGAAGSADDTHE